MSKVILDTDILSESLKARDPNVFKHGDAYSELHTQFTSTSVTAYETAFGLVAKGATRQLRDALRWLRNNEQILPIDEYYLTAARVKGTAKQQGSVVELPDCLIASVAARLRLTLITGNTDDFEAIKRTGLPIELDDWRKP